MNILSIDFDVIMHPSIKTYNNYINSKRDLSDLWKNVEAETCIELYSTYNALLLMHIARLLKEAKEVRVCEHHRIVADEIILNGWKHVNVCNMDFHHDLTYQPDARIGKPGYPYGDGNWLGHVQLAGYVDKIIWVAPDNVDNLRPECNFGFEFEKYPLSYVTTASGATFDKVYFIKSSHWIPPKFRHLYDLIVYMLDESKVVPLEAKETDDADN